MKELNVIGDVAGNCLSAIALVAKMPDCNTLFVGDLMDRGPRSKQMIEWVMNSDKLDSLMGNHEHLMIDHCRGTGLYQRGVWFYNGGRATVDSFGGHETNIPEDVLRWTETRSLYKEVGEDTLVTHAFLPGYSSLEEACVLLDKFGRFGTSDESIIWSRSQPRRRKKWPLQVAGHNAHWGYCEFKDEEGLYAVGIDTGGSEGRLTGLHLPTMEKFTQEIID